MKKTTLLISISVLFFVGCVQDTNNGTANKNDESMSKQESNESENQSIKEENVVAEFHGDNEIRAGVDYDNEIDYIDLARYPDKYESVPIKRVATILQVIPGDDYNKLIARYASYEEAKDGDERHIVIIPYNPDVLAHRLMADDVIELYGVGAGITTYKTTTGITEEAPLIIPHSIWLFID